MSFTLDTTRPVINVTNPPAKFATNKNFSITGQVTDALDTATLQGAFNTGGFAPVTLNSSGNFSITTSLLLNGSQDGTHIEHLKATDQAGNVSTLDVSFVLKTTPPTQPTFDLAAGTADLGPETTSAAHVTLVGQTDPGRDGHPGRHQPDRSGVRHGHVPDPRRHAGPRRQRPHRPG